MDEPPAPDALGRRADEPVPAEAACSSDDASPPPGIRHDVGLGVSRLLDPRVALTSVASMTVGAAAAAAHGAISWTWLTASVAGVLLVEVAKNASGDVFDWDSGADAAVRQEERSPYSGGRRVLVDGLLTRRETIAIAVTAYVLAVLVGLVIMSLREPRVLWLGVAGIVLALAYHAPPLRLSYRGLGELAVAVCYGPLVAAGTYLVQRGRIDSVVLLASVPVGLAIASFVWINEMPDSRADAWAGKRTLVVRLGHRRSAEGFAILVVAAHVAVVLLPHAGLPVATLLGLAGWPLAVAAARRALARPDTVRELVPAQTWTLLALLLMAAGLAAGLVLGV